MLTLSNAIRANYMVIGPNFIPGYMRSTIGTLLNLAMG
jgi:hypothetical protein